MKCCDVKNKIYALVDNQLSNSEAERILLHINNCDSCKKEYHEITSILDELRISAENLPDINITLEQLLEERNLCLEETKMKKKKLIFNRPVFKKVISYAAVFFLGIALYAAAAGGLFSNSSVQSSMDSSNSAISDSNIQREESGSVIKDGQYGENSSAEDETTSNDLQLASDKIIYNGSVVIEVDNYDDARENILKLVEENKGFIQNEDKSISIDGSNKYYTSYFIIRIPADQFKSVSEELEQIGQVEYSSSYATNVTYEYNDIEATIEQLEIQKKRLLELYDQANKISEIIEIENELTRVNTEISQNESMLKNYDRAIEYSTIELSISEDVSQNSLVNPFNDIEKKIKSAFVNSINAFLSAIVTLCIFIIRVLPFIIVLLIIFLIIRFIFKKRNNKKMLIKEDGDTNKDS